MMVQPLYASAEEPEPTTNAVPRVEDFVVDTLARICRREETCVTTKTELSSLGIDSLTLMAVATHAAVVYGVEIESDDMRGLLRCRLASDVIELFRHVLGEIRQ